MRAAFVSAVLLAAVAATAAAAAAAQPEDLDALMVRVRRDVRGMQDDIQQLFKYLLNGPGKGQVYNRLAYMTDTFGPRLSGSQAYDDAVQWIMQAATQEGLQNVHGEDVQVPVWHRGNESAYLLEPRVKQLAILGLGTSIGTPNITAEALVVQSFDELQQQAAVGNTSGKIIVFNQQCNWTAQPVGCYGLTAQYRYSGASEASRVGGVAALVRSLTGFSIYSPHTGVQGYDDDVVPIPAASITVEDADMLQRMQARGQRIVITLSMQAQNMGNTTQQNFIAEVVGSQYPDQVVLVSGHLDSWDVGQGAMDDGGGAFISWEVLSAVNALGLKPKRTLRFLGWACEEFGGIGADQYFAAHQDEVPNMDFVLESDMGTFTPYGIQFTGNAAAQAVMREVLQLLQPINATTLVLGGGGEDVNPWMRAGVPGGSLANYNHNYFDFHHSNGDTMDVYTPDELDLAAATWAVTAYAVANLQDMLPRNSTAHPPPPPAKPWMWR